MRLVAVSMVRNEADVVEAFVRHHASLVDEHVVVDHRSLDGTREILRELEREGLPLSARVESSLAQRQSSVLTAAMREAAAAGADWVLPLDADEVVLDRDGSLRDRLGELPADRPALVRARLYVPRAEDAPDEANPFARIRHRRGDEAALPAAKVFVPRRVAGSAAHRLLQGNHGVADAREGARMHAPLTAGVALGHFPVRSADQLRGKILAGWLAHCARTDRRSTEAVHWKRLFDRIARGARLDGPELERIALTYDAVGGDEPSQPGELVLDPVPVDYRVRLTRPRAADPFELAIRTAEGLVEELRDAVLRAGADGRVTAIGAAAR